MRGNNSSKILSISNKLIKLGKRSFSTKVLCVIPDRGSLGSALTKRAELATQLVPPQAIKVYKDSDLDKPRIVSENNGKAGVYR